MWTTRVATRPTGTIPNSPSLPPLEPDSAFHYHSLLMNIRWLNAWQAQDIAWSMADELLHDASAPQPVQFLSAQTLRCVIGSPPGGTSAIPNHPPPHPSL